MTALRDGVAERTSGKNVTANALRREPRLPLDSVWDALLDTILHDVLCVVVHRRWQCTDRVERWIAPEACGTLLRMPPKPWEERWIETGKELGRGGQGATKLVRSQEGGMLAALKVLHNQRDRDRRGRMAREAVALQTLEHRGIPKFIDGNTDRFSATDPLYMVLEYIEGETLSTAVSRAPLAFADAVGLCLAILDALEYAHKNDIGHRDIKPDNVMLRGGSPLDPVLIDFGLSFNAEESGAISTESEQQIGNRFLRLPELETPGSDKRDYRSDLTSIVGLLYFAVSGLQPMTLRDADGRAPHNRDRFLPVINGVEATRRLRVVQLFARAFQQRIDARFQNADELRAALNGVMEERQHAPADDVGDIFRAIQVATDESEKRLQDHGEQMDRVGDALTSYLVPTVDAVVEEVERLRGRSIPLMMMNPRRPMRNLVVFASSARPPIVTVVEIMSNAPRVKQFTIKINLVHGPTVTEDYIPFYVEATLQHEDESLTGENWVIDWQGKWYKAVSTPYAPSDSNILTVIRSWLLDARNWSRPQR